MLLIRSLITCVHQPAQLGLKLLTPPICCSRSQFTWIRQSHKFSPLKKAALTTVLSATCFVGFYRVHINYGTPQDPSAKKRKMELILMSLSNRIFDVSLLSINVQWLGKEIESFFPAVAQDLILFFGLIVLIVTGHVPSMFLDRIHLNSSLGKPHTDNKLHSMVAVENMQKVVTNQLKTSSTVSRSGNNIIISVWLPNGTILKAIKLICN